MADDPVNILGTVHMDSFKRSNVFDRVRGRGSGTTGNVSASLKFDIPGLRDFKTQLDAINATLIKLDTTFVKLAKAPEAFSKSLENIAKQMKALQAAQVQGNRYVSKDTPPQRDPIGQATAAAQGTGPGGQAPSGGKPGQGVAAIVTDAAKAMFQRFDANMKQAIASDVYVSRMSAYAGGNNPRTPAGIFRQQGRQGFGFMATDMTQANQVLYQGTGIGAYYGASGRSGEWASSYQRSIKQMQEVMPGLDAQQGASAQTAIYGNVTGIRMTQAILGKQVSPYRQGGGRKTQQEYFREILTALQRLPRPNGKTGAWSKNDIMQMNFPGSRLNIWLGSILPEEAISMWYEWAITNAAVSEATGQQLSDDPKIAKKQREQVMGRSLALNAQESTNREAQREATFTGEQYGTMNARLDYEKQTVGLLQSIDSTLKGAYGVTGRVPSLLQGPVAGALGGGDGDPGYMPMGDPEHGVSHLTPDLRKRVNSMMAANPNLKISSAYRDNRRQQSLQGKGPFAPSGKSTHGRGWSVDMGPSSQLGWIAKNARKFGLDSATGYGEPWHVQLAGSITMGDPPTGTSAIDPSARAREDEKNLSESIVSGYLTKWFGTGKGTTGATGSTPTAGGTPTSGGTGGTGAGGTPSSGGTSDYVGGTLDPNFTPGDSGALSADQIVQLAFKAGFRGDALVSMVAIAKRESGYKPAAHRTTADPSKMLGDRGLWQINYVHDPGLIKAGIIQNATDLLDPLKNAQAAFYLSGGGSNLSPWNAAKGGFSSSGSSSYGTDENAARQAVDAARAAGEISGDVGYAGVGASAGNGGSNTVVGGTSVVFNNTFQLSFPNGTSRSSVDVAVRQIGARLESQMQRTVSRRT